MAGFAVRDDVAIDGGHPDEHDQAGQKAFHPEILAFTGHLLVAGTSSVQRVLMV